jgi:phosphate transport system permease protein
VQVNTRFNQGAETRRAMHMTSTTGRSTVDAYPAGDLSGTGRGGDRLFGGLASASGILVVTVVAAVGAFLVIEAVPSLLKNQANFLTDRVWSLDNADAPRFGIPDLLWATVAIAMIAMLLAVPVAVGVALFLTEYAPARLARPATDVVDLLAAVPSIIYGLWGIKVLLPYAHHVQDGLNATLGWIPLFRDVGVSQGTIFLAGVVLAIMVLPIVTALSREVFAQVPASHKEGALALGATRWEMIRTAVLPFGQAGVISAAMLGLGRALGETIAVTIIVSQVAQFNFSIFNGGQTFASKIANNAAEFDSATKTGAFIAAGLVLFVLTFVVNAVARIVIERRKAFIE